MSDPYSSISMCCFLYRIHGVIGLSPGILMLFGSLSSYLGKLMEIAELGAQPSCIERSRKIARSAAALNGDPSNKRIDLSEHLSKCVYVYICYARNICICINKYKYKYIYTIYICLIYIIQLYTYKCMHVTYAKTRVYIYINNSYTVNIYLMPIVRSTKWSHC
jgi:hypothetical protein